MAQLTALIVTQEEHFRQEISRLLRAGGVPVGIVEARRPGADGSVPDIAVVDIRGDASSGLASIERLRATMPAAAIFAIAGAAGPELILAAMRAGANEFFTWSPGGEVAGATEQAFHGAVRRTAARRETSPGGASQSSVTLLFFGAKGGTGTTTMSVNCGVELARLTKRPTVIVDLKSSLGEVALFLGVRPRFTVSDAIENLHRLDREFLRELVAKHKSGLDILAAAEQIDRAGVQDPTAIEELLRVLARHYDYIVVDAGNLISGSTIAAFYAADTIFLVTNPDVPSVRNAQRLVDRVRQLGAGSERVRLLLNRASEESAISPSQIESALGYTITQTFSSDYRTVSTALNSGVPLALANHSEIAAQFGRFTRQLLAPPGATAAPEPEKRRSTFLGLF
jgi:pilus assembly protein CpaE